MCQTDGTPYNHLGARTSERDYILRLRYCPSCIRGMHEQYGEAYWKRSHQLPSSFVCDLHEETLVESIVEVTKTRHGYYAVSLLVPDETSTEIRCPVTKQVLVLAARIGAALLSENRADLAAEIQRSTRNWNFDEPNLAAIITGFEMEFGSARAKVLRDSVMGIEPMAGRRPMDLVIRYAILETQKIQDEQLV